MTLMKSILCVDDEPHNLDALRRTLRKEYEVHTALSGEEGLLILLKHKIDLIITDQRMPNMTGVEFLSKSIDICPETTRIILTGYTDPQDLIDAINTGRIYYYLTKPWEPNELRNVIRTALEKQDQQE